jgi:hypothetical protein
MHMRNARLNEFPLCSGSFAYILPIRIFSCDLDEFVIFFFVPLLKLTLNNISRAHDLKGGRDR